MDAIPAVPRPRGFPDRVGTEVTAAEDAANAAIQTLTARGYSRIDTPIVERSELFLRRSGGVLASQMYEFTGPDGSRLSLRPEMTAPVIRYAIDQGDALELPARYQYCGPVFRYPDPTLTGSDRPSDALRQFTQLGAELLGDPSPEADAEIISAAIESAQAMGCKDIEVKLGHVGAVRAVLGNLDLPPRAQLFIANNIDELKRNESRDSIRERAAESGLLPNQIDPPIDADSRSDDDWPEMDDEDQDALSAASFEHGLDLASRLANIDDQVQSASKSLQSLFREISVRDDRCVDELLRIGESESLARKRNAAVSVDLGLPVAIAYYTGAIFDLSATNRRGERLNIGSGGRYNDLATVLGATTPLPALGFALSIEEALGITLDSRQAGSDG